MDLFGGRNRRFWTGFFIPWLDSAGQIGYNRDYKERRERGGAACADGSKKRPVRQGTA